MGRRSQYIVPVRAGGPLNPTLYDRLTYAFGKVEISAQGDRAILGTPRGDGSENLLDEGEYYRINCPFCNDMKRRLYINHRWNTPDAGTEKPLRHLAVCFNDDCLKRHYRAFEEMLAEAEVRVPGQGRLTQKPVYDDRPVALIMATPPGEIVPLDELPEQHKAMRYMVDRGFDPVLLARDYGVGLCTRASLYPAMNGRIYIPVVMDGELVAWQGRWAGDDFKKFGAKKYYNLRGCKKSRMLYGYDRAKDAKCLVVVEGVSDVWAVGDGSVALLGKTMSARQRDLLLPWAEKGGLLALMLDAEAWTSEQKDPVRAKKKHDALMEELRVMFKKRVVEVALPAKCDPGSLSRQANRRIIRSAVREAGFVPSEYGL